MNKLKLLFCSSLFLSQIVCANVENGEFDSWTNGSPDGWTTIDSGISLNQSTSVIQSGLSAAAVTVTTRSQGSTDLRQSFSVSAGETTTFSTWLYHTEGGMKARLYVDGYRGYSDQSQVNKWQQISHTYTASSTGTIMVGLRFYDTAGFDGNEIVYIDNYQPNAGNSGSGSGSGDCNAGTFNLSTDNYASETSWQIVNSLGISQASGSGLANNTSYTEDLCLANGEYTLSLDDSYGDGICCQYGNGSYILSFNGQTFASGGSFTSQDITSFTLGTNSPPPTSGYYTSANGLNGYALKSALHDIIKTHISQGYGALWTFYSNHEIDSYYENDGTILDVYSERPTSNDPYVYTPVSNQCGNYSAEGNCYNREHSFPRSWFGGAIEPMNSDVHHIFATDGYVNSKRGSFPFGEVGSTTFSSNNGSKLGNAASGLGYSGTVFEPIDEFKGDFARAHFYMATRYQNVIAGWENNSSSVDAVLNGNSSSVFENWVVAMLKTWHSQDPVSQKELDRNEAAYLYQGNRNPFVDHPEFVNAIWGN